MQVAVRPCPAGVVGAAKVAEAVGSKESVVSRVMPSEVTVDPYAAQVVGAVGGVIAADSEEAVVVHVM